MLDDKSLSTSAHNIKIVPGRCRNTARPGASADEKKRVEALAMQAATGKQVRNEISIARLSPQLRPDAFIILLLRNHV